jgi:putative phosphoesterase
MRDTRRTQKKRLCRHRKYLAGHRVQSGRGCRLKICIVSDSHDHREPLASAVAEAKSLGARAVLHCGDLIAPSTLHAVLGLELPIHLIHGNNAGDLFFLSRFAQEHGKRLHYYGQDGTLELAGKRVFLVHYPHYAKAMALTGDYDLVCNGHEHRAVIEHIPNIKGGTTLRIDPGTVAGVSAPKTYVFGDLQTLDFEIRPVPL